MGRKEACSTILDYCSPSASQRTRTVKNEPNGLCMRRLSHPCAEDVILGPNLDRAQEWGDHCVGRSTNPKLAPLNAHYANNWAAAPGAEMRFRCPSPYRNTGISKTGACPVQLVFGVLVGRTNRKQPERLEDWYQEASSQLQRAKHEGLPLRPRDKCWRILGCGGWI